MFNKKNGLYVIALIWLISILISIPYSFMTYYVTEPDQCQLNMNLMHIIYVLTVNVIFIFMPAVTLIVFYILIIIRLERLNKLMKAHELQNLNQPSVVDTSESLIKKKNSQPKEYENFLMNSSSLDSQEHNEIFISDYRAKMRLILITYLKAFLFFSFHLPIKIFIFWSYINYYIHPVSLNEIDVKNDFKIQLTDLLSNIATLIYFLHCISNPIIYNFSSTKFLNALFN